MVRIFRLMLVLIYIYIVLIFLQLLLSYDIWKSKSSVAVACFLPGRAKDCPVHSLMNIQILQHERNLSASIKYSRAEFIGYRFQWPRGPRSGSAAVRLLGMRVRIPPGYWYLPLFESSVLSARDLCFVLKSLVQTSPNEFVVSECDHEAP
jgi:hypothetical protein